MDLLIIGGAVAAFVGVNIGGSSTGIAWGPAVGAGIIGKTAAAALMTVFVFLGGWTVGRNVIGTLGDGIVPGSAFTPEASIAVLLFIGLGILVANIFGVPVPTSMTAVGAIAGLGFARGTVDQGLLATIVMWWVVTPLVAFWIGGAVGRYLYPHLDRFFQLEQSSGPLVALSRAGPVPYPTAGPGTTGREAVSVALIVVIGCYMAFGAGASNVANAVAPLVGNDMLATSDGIVLATAAISLGGFTIARRTMESVGNDLTELPLLAALVVAITAASITTVLSWIGIPISLVMGTVMTMVGLGWGRASRPARLTELGRGDLDLTVDALTLEPQEKPAGIGDEPVSDIEGATRLVNPGAVSRFVSMWVIGPAAAAGLSFAFFALTGVGG